MNSNKILIIDDSLADRELFKGYIEETCTNSKYEFLEAETGTEGLDMYQQNDLYLVFLDHELPGQSGTEILKSIQELGQPKCPIVFLTGMGDEKLVLQAWKSGAHDYLPKGSINAEKIGRTIENVTATFNLQNNLIQADNILRDKLRQKDDLLREVYHRVKNNFQSVISLLEIQASSIADPQILSHFKIAQLRIFSMLHVHNTLSKSDDLNTVQLEPFLKELIDRVVDGWASSNTDIKIEVSAPNVLITQKDLKSLSLITNELVTNSLKYAFTGLKEGKIRVEFTEDQEGNVVGTYADDGVGIKGDIDLGKSSSIGLILVNNLIQQIRGTLEVIKPSQGTCFKIAFQKAPLN